MKSLLAFKSLKERFLKNQVIPSAKSVEDKSVKSAREITCTLPEELTECFPSLLRC